MYISKEISANSRGKCLYNHKDILVIYLQFGSYPLPQQASPTSPPFPALILLQTLCIFYHKEEGNIWAVVWNSVMNPSNILFPSKVIFNFIAVCLCIPPTITRTIFILGKNGFGGLLPLWILLIYMECLEWRVLLCGWASLPCWWLPSTEERVRWLPSQGPGLLPVVVLICFLLKKNLPLMILTLCLPKSP